MHFIVLAAVLPLAIANAGLSPRSLLLPRQGGDAFVPGIGSTVTNCATPCGDTECLDVPRGDTCCTEGCEWPLSVTRHEKRPFPLIANRFPHLSDGCPGGSFCLTQGFCCPDVSTSTIIASYTHLTLCFLSSHFVFTIPMLSQYHRRPVYLR